MGQLQIGNFENKKNTHSIVNTSTVGVAIIWSGVEPAGKSDLEGKVLSYRTPLSASVRGT